MSTKCAICRKATATLEWHAPDTPRQLLRVCQDCFAAKPKTVGELKKYLGRFDVALPPVTPKKADILSLYKRHIETDNSYSKPLSSSVTGVKATPKRPSRSRSRSPSTTSQRPIAPRSRAARSTTIASDKSNKARRSPSSSRSRSPARSKRGTVSARRSSRSSVQAGTLAGSTNWDDTTPVIDDIDGDQYGVPLGSSREGKSSTPRTFGSSPLVRNRTPTSSSTIADSNASSSTGRPTWLGPFILLTALLAVFLAASRERRSALPYCDSGSNTVGEGNSDVALLGHQGSCLPCSKHGTCTRGTMKCEPGYIEMHGLCVEDHETVLASHEVVDHIRYILALRKGLVECGEIDHSQTAILSVDDLKTALMMSREHQSIGHRFDTAFTKAVDLLQQNEGSWNLTITAKRTYSRKMDLHFESQTSIKTVKCQLKQWMYRNPLYLLLFAIALAVSLSLIIIRRRDRFAAQLHQEICQRLEMEKQSNYLLLRHELITKHGESVSTVWSKVESLVKANPIIRELSTSDQGQPVRIWQWTGSVRQRPTKPAQRSSSSRGRGLYPSLSSQ